MSTKAKNILALCAIIGMFIWLTILTLWVGNLQSQSVTRYNETNIKIASLQSQLDALNAEIAVRRSRSEARVRAWENRMVQDSLDRLNIPKKIDSAVEKKIQETKIKHGSLFQIDIPKDKFTPLEMVLFGAIGVLFSMGILGVKYAVKKFEDLNKQHNADLMAVMPLIQSVRDSLAIILQRLP